MVVKVVALHRLTTEVLLIQLGAKPPNVDAAHDAYTSVTVIGVHDDVGSLEASCSLVEGSFEVTGLLIGVKVGFGLVGSGEDPGSGIGMPFVPIVTVGNLGVGGGMGGDRFREVLGDPRRGQPLLRRTSSARRQEPLYGGHPYP